MATTMEYTGKDLQAPDLIGQPVWQRIILLAVLGFEAAGCLFGASLLVVAPDGKYLGMPMPSMHSREVIATGGGTLTDTLHIVWAMLTLLFNILVMGFGAAGLGKPFRLFTIATFVVFVVFGVLIGIEAPGIERKLPTPRIGVWKRINIGVFMLWVVAIAIALLRKESSTTTSKHLKGLHLTLKNWLLSLYENKNGIVI